MYIGVYRCVYVCIGVYIDKQIHIHFSTHTLMYIIHMLLPNVNRSSNVNSRVMLLFEVRVDGSAMMREMVGWR